MDLQAAVRAIRTPATLLLLVALVVLAGQWGLKAVTAPVPPRPPAPCVVKQIGPKLLPEHVYVNVFNGTKTGGLAKRLGSVLSADGFKVLRRVNADRDDLATSELVGHSENAPEVVLVRQAFESITFRADGRIDHSVDVIIGAEQPKVRANPSFGVDLPDGTACLPQVQQPQTGG